MEQLQSTGEVARALGIRRYQLEYLIETGAVEDTAYRLAGKRGWSKEQVEAVRNVLRERGRGAARQRT